jgi:hypothetical protein
VSMQKDIYVAARKAAAADVGVVCPTCGDPISSQLTHERQPYWEPLKTVRVCLTCEGERNA